MTKNDRKENKLEILKKKLKDLNLSRKRSKQYRPERKRKLDPLDQITRQKITGKGTSEPGRPQKVDIADLIEAICQIAIPGSAAHEIRRNELIRTVKTLDQLTESLNY